MKLWVQLAFDNEFLGLVLWHKLKLISQCALLKLETIVRQMDLYYFSQIIKLHSIINAGLDWYQLLAGVYS